MKGKTKSIIQEIDQARAAADMPPVFSIFPDRADENARHLTEYRERYKRLLNHPEHEAGNIVHMLVCGLGAGDRDSIEALLALADETLKALGNASEASSIQGRELFIRLLLMLHKSIDRLNFQVFNKPSEFQPVAEKLDAWPALIHAHTETRQAVEKVILSMNLGADTPLNVASAERAFSLRTPGTRIAYSLWRRLRAYRRGRYAPEAIHKAGCIECEKSNHPCPPMPRGWAEKVLALPAMSRTNYRQWASAAKPVVEAIYGKNFETHEVFRAIAGLHQRSFGQTARQRTAGPGKIRDMLWKKVVAGFESLSKNFATNTPLINPTRDAEAIATKSRHGSTNSKQKRRRS